MSKWRKEGSERLPELQKIIAAREIESPMMLWIELRAEFEKRCCTPEVSWDLLKRVWQYCVWSLKHPCDEVRTAAALGFCEHLLDTDSGCRAIPKVMSRAEFRGFREILEYHNEPEVIDRWEEVLWS